MDAAEQFYNQFHSNERLCATLGAVDLSGADAPTRFAVSKMLRNMGGAGTDQEPDVRATAVELGNQMDRLCRLFAENIVNGDRSIVIDQPSELQGLSTEWQRNHSPDFDGKVRVSTRNVDGGPVFLYADDPGVQRRMDMAFMNRAYPENEPVLKQLLELRFRFSPELLGCPSYAAYALENTMLRNPGEVRSFLERAGSLLRDPTGGSSCESSGENNGMIPRQSGSRGVMGAPTTDTTRRKSEGRSSGPTISRSGHSCLTFESRRTFPSLR